MKKWRAIKRAVNDEIQVNSGRRNVAEILNGEDSDEESREAGSGEPFEHGVEEPGMESTAEERVIATFKDMKRRRDKPLFADMKMREFLQWWITTSGIKLKASNILLKYLKTNIDDTLPTDYRTILGTPSCQMLIDIPPGKYVHVGLEKALKRTLSGVETSPEELELQIFIDGVAISRSTSDGFWVIMVAIINLTESSTPKLVGIYEGKKKPDDFNELIYPFVMELLHLDKMGFINAKGEARRIKIKNFVLDAPARTGIKQVRHINGFYGCDICITQGEYIDNRMAYPDTDAPLRTDEEFRNRIYDEEYHKKESLLELLPAVDMIDSFPLDVLHCSYLGVMRWILSHLKTASKTLSKRDWEVMSSRIGKYRFAQPSEFQRRLRLFNEVGNFKGTEFRQYALFVAPILLKGIISDEKVDNLVKFQLASIIFTHSRFKEFYNQAHQMMKLFLDEFGELYHRRHLTYVFHALCHFQHFCEIYGPWEGFSTFKFESENFSLKKLVRSPNLRVTQIANRIEEACNAPKLKTTPHDHVNVTVRVPNEEGSYSKMKCFGLKFAVDEESESWILSKQREVLKIVRIKKGENNSVIIETKRIKRLQSLYDIVDTRRFHIFKIQKDFDTEPLLISPKDIDGKFWAFDIENGFHAMFPIYPESAK